MKNKIIVVTGGFGALGQTVCATLAGLGAHVIAVDIADQAPGSVADALGDAGMALGGCDLADPEAAAGAIDAAVGRFGSLDALINLAGGFAWETVAGGSLATWSRLYALNVLTCANMCRAAISPLSASQGRIVNVGAAGALKAAAGMGAYAAAKSGVHRLTEALAEELKGKIAVNAVLPSIIDTKQNRTDMPDADPSLWVAPAELAQVIAFLASDAASGMTGALVPVTGRV